MVLGVCGLLWRARTTFRVFAPRAKLPLAPKNMPEPSSVDWIDEATSSAGSSVVASSGETSKAVDPGTQERRFKKMCFRCKQVGHKRADCRAVLEITQSHEQQRPP